MKTRNYTLEDQARKQRSALGDATAKVTVLQQELQKSKKTIEKSKKLTEVQKVIIENDNLHKKILAQEEDFRLQNQTLLNELSLVSTLRSSQPVGVRLTTYSISSSSQLMSDWRNKLLLLHQTRRMA